MKRYFYCLIAALFLSSWSGVQTIAGEGGPSSLKDIAGDYYFGDGTGVNCNFKLTKQGKFTFRWQGCLGTYDENNGDASVEGGVLHILPRKANVREGFQGTPTEFFPVRWGDRIYLIPTNDIIAFCSDVNQGSEPRRINFGQYYLRQNDWDKPVPGRPIVPAQWTKYFLSQPVRGKIAQLIGKQEAWIDVGAETGLLKGMILTAQSHGKIMFSQVRVEVVEKGRCRVKCEWKDSELEVGQTVSSRFQD